MSRLNRAQAQQRDRARVLAAARAEFTDRGFRDAKVDVIAERAELTRGAVYSNFPGKRALYLAVLAEDAERTPALSGLEPGRTVRSALAAFATAWLAHLPLAVDQRGGTGPLGSDLLPAVLAAPPRLPPPPGVPARRPPPPAVRAAHRADRGRARADARGPAPGSRRPAGPG